MNCRSNKIASVFFLLLGLAPLLFILVAVVKKWDIRERMKERLKTEELQTIILPENQVQWMDKHEIWVNEHMFDIHSQKLENGVYTFTGLYDEEETLLVKRERNVNEQNQKRQYVLFQLLKSLPVFFQPHAESYAIFTLKEPFSSTNCGFNAAGFTEILTPPPQQCSLSM